MVKDYIPRYLKKRKLYILVKSLINEEIPLCKDFEYSFYQGSEWITGGNYRISSMSCGYWIRIRRSHFDEKKVILFTIMKLIPVFGMANTIITVLTESLWKCLFHKKYGGSEL